MIITPFVPATVGTEAAPAPTAASGTPTTAGDSAQAGATDAAATTPFEELLAVILGNVEATDKADDDELTLGDLIAVPTEVEPTEHQDPIVAEPRPVALPDDSSERTSEHEADELIQTVAIPFETLPPDTLTDNAPHLNTLTDNAPQLNKLPLLTSALAASALAPSAPDATDQVAVAVDAMTPPTTTTGIETPAPSSLIAGSAATATSTTPVPTTVPEATGGQSSTEDATPVRETSTVLTDAAVPRAQVGAPGQPQKAAEPLTASAPTATSTASSDTSAAVATDQARPPDAGDTHGGQLQQQERPRELDATPETRPETATATTGRARTDGATSDLLPRGIDRTMMPTPGGGETPAATVAAPVGNSALTTVPVRTIGDQLAPVRPVDLPALTGQQVVSMQRSGETQRSIVLRLDPPELGVVTIELTTVGEEIIVAARTNSSDAVRALMRERADLQTVMQALGMNLSEFDVKAGSEEENRRWAAARRQDGRHSGTDAAFELAGEPDDDGAIFL